jgi:hypothetical protein
MNNQYEQRRKSVVLFTYLYKYGSINDGKRFLKCLGKNVLISFPLLVSASILSPLTALLESNVETKAQSDYK